MVVGALHEDLLEHLLIGAEAKVGHRKLLGMVLDLGLRGFLSDHFLLGYEWLWGLAVNWSAWVFNFGVDVLITIFVLNLFFTFRWASSLD